MTTIKNYRCTVTKANGDKIDAGEWKVEDTGGTVWFTPNTKNEDYVTLKCPKDNKGKHKLNDWFDGTYTVYPFKLGTPYHFEPIT